MRLQQDSSIPSIVTGVDWYWKRLQRCSNTRQREEPCNARTHDDLHQRIDEGKQVPLHHHPKNESSYSRLARNRKIDMGIK